MSFPFVFFLIIKFDKEQINILNTYKILINYKKMIAHDIHANMCKCAHDEDPRSSSSLYIIVQRLKSSFHDGFLSFTVSPPLTGSICIKNNIGFCYRGFLIFSIILGFRAFSYIFKIIL